MSKGEHFAEYSGFEVAAGGSKFNTLAPADMSTINSGLSRAVNVEEHSSPLHTEISRDSGLALQV